RVPPDPSSCSRCEDRELVERISRFEPFLSAQPLTQAGRATVTAVVNGRRQQLFFDPAGSASSAFVWQPDDVLPVIEVTDGFGRRWLPRRDLLSIDAFAPEFVVEIDNDGATRLRFGDGEYGRRPATGVELTAS